MDLFVGFHTMRQTNAGLVSRWEMMVRNLSLLYAMTMIFIYIYIHIYICIHVCVM